MRTKPDFFVCFVQRWLRNSWPVMSAQRILVDWKGCECFILWVESPKRCVDLLGVKQLHRVREGHLKLFVYCVLFGDCVAYSEASFQLKVDHCPSLQFSSWAGSLLFLFLEFSQFSCGLYLHGQNNNNNKKPSNGLVDWIQSHKTLKVILNPTWHT